MIEKQKPAKDDLICGVPAIKLRDILKNCEHCNFWPNTVAKEASIPKSDVQAFLKKLARAKLIEKSKEQFDQSAISYVLSEEGNWLSKLKFGSKITSKKADELLLEALRRCADINRRGELEFWVSRVYLFGSHLRREEKVGDVDIAVALEPRGKNKVGTRGGLYPNVTDFVSTMLWNLTEVVMLIKGPRGRQVAVTYESELEKLECDSKIVWEKGMKSFVKPAKFIPTPVFMGVAFFDPEWDAVREKYGLFDPLGDADFDAHELREYEHDVREADRMQKLRDPLGLEPDWVSKKFVPQPPRAIAR